MATIAITDEKKKHITNLIKSYKSIDSAILPFQEQRKELRKEYIENDWLSNEEISLVKKAYNAVKTRVDLEDLSSFMDIVKKEFPGV
jgi:predicted nuclease with TOPRIM domain